jgi:hypothetical protein
MKSTELLRLLSPDGLVGYRIAAGYFAQLEHSLMGFFPALISEDKKFFVCTDLKVLEEVLKKLPRRRFIITKIVLLTNDNARIGFCMKTLAERLAVGEEIESIRIVCSNDVESIAGFMWAPGLLSNDMSIAEFRDTLVSAMAAV